MTIYIILGLVLLTGSAQCSVQSIRATYRSLPLTNPNLHPQGPSITLPTTTTPIMTSTTPILDNLPTPAAQIQAQEREGQHDNNFVSTSPPPPPPTENFSPVQTTPSNQFQPILHNSFQPYQNPEQPIQYSAYVYSRPLPNAGNNLQQQMAIRMYNPSYMGKQQPEFDTEGQRPVQDVSSSTSWYSNFQAKDALVGLAVLGLIGSGSALWYHQLTAKGKSSRALLELAEQFGNEETTRVARGVLLAIKRYSALNNADFSQ